MTTRHCQPVPIVNLDSACLELRDEATLRHAPVLEIFGSASSGWRARMHIHGSFLYLLVSADGTQPSENESRELAARLDKSSSLATALADSDQQQHVYRNSFMSSIELHGYQSEKEHFIKLGFKDPADVYKAAELLSGGEAMRQLFEPCETQKPYPLQVDQTLLVIINAAAIEFRRQGKDNKCDNGKHVGRMDSLHEDTFATERLLLEDSVSLRPALEPCRRYMWFEENVERSHYELDDSENQWSLYNTDTEDECSDEEIPQFDGTSDKNSGNQKKSDQIQAPAAANQTTAPVPASEDSSSKSQTPGSTPESSSASSDFGWRGGTASRGLGNPQNNSTSGSSSGSWTPQAWQTQQQQQSGSGNGPWHSQGQQWPQQQYQSWPHQQHMTPGYPSPQTPFRSSSPATSFQSSPHSQYASPTHQPSYQTPSPSQYQYPHFQSPQSSSSSHTYQQPYPQASSSQHPSQTFQPYHSSSPGQPYQPVSATSQPFQPATSAKPYSSSSSNNQLYQPQSTNLPYQSPPQSFQSPQGNPYQPSSGQMYPYQSAAHCQQTSQPYTHPYQSPVQEGCYPNKPAWSPQACSGYYQGNMATSYGTGSQNSSGKHLAESSQTPPQQSSSNMLYRQHGHQGPSGQGNMFNAQCTQQQQADVLPCKPSVTPNMVGGLEPQSNQTQPKKTDKKKRDSSKSGSSKASHLPRRSPTPITIIKSPVEQPYSSANTSSLNPEANVSQAVSQDHKNPQGEGRFTSIKPMDGASVTKISTLEFKPDTTSTVSSLGNELSTDKPADLFNVVKSSTTDVEKVEASSSTPMIQQLLMEEPVRMNIKKEARDAVMKKPMASPTLPKPKRKYKTRVSKAAKPAGRPRSTSMTSPGPSMMGYCGYSPQPMMNSPVVGRPERSHSFPLPFSCETRMTSPVPSYDWQHWKQQPGFPPSNQWHQKQQWQMNEWDNFDMSAEQQVCNTGDMVGDSGTMMSRLQQRSYTRENIQSPVDQQPSQTNQVSPFCDNQNVFQNNATYIPKSSAETDTPYSSQGNASDKSSLSSLFQLVSDVGSDDIGWENAAVSVPNLFFNSNDSETPRSTATPDINQESPPEKDFITLETPCKQETERANSDITGMTSSEESDRMDFDISCDLRPKAVGRPHSLGDGHSRVGKQNRLKKLGFLHARSTESGSVACPMGSNPAYTYTFHVPTTVFKKLKFFRSPEVRGQNVKVVRMHPMDARRYSLLKIGREIVKAVKLSEADFARYNVTLPLPSHFVSADGSTNRVNLDIPTVSADKRSGDNSGDDSSFSRFDIDFPPNKVAPPSSFHASQVSASMARASATSTRGSPVGSDWMRQFAGQHQESYNGGFSPGSRQAFSTQQGNYSGSHQVERSLNTYAGHQQMSHSSNRQFGYQQSEVLSGTPYHHQFSQKRNTSYMHMPHSTGNPPEHPLNPPAEYMNNSIYSLHHQHYPQYHHQQQQHRHIQQQQQQDPNGSQPEPKNGLRSPGQHGLVSRIDNGRVNGHSGDHKIKHEEEDATEASHFNPRVNAQRLNNHAEQEANSATMDYTSACSISKQTGLDHHQSTDDKNDNSSDLNLLTEHNYLIEKQENNKERHSDLAVSRAYPCHHPLDTEETRNSHHMINNNCAISEVDSPSLAQLSKCENQNTSILLKPNCARRKSKLSCRKNIKSLSLRIPKPQVIPNHVCLDGITDDSPEYIQRGSVRSSTMDSAEVDATERSSLTAIRRSTRSSTQIDLKSVLGHRQKPRQAKLRSIYSKYKLKPKKRRKKQALVEGIHYIVVGKFKGHQAMRVRLKKLHVKPSERVRADIYEQRAAQDIIRVISPLSCHESFECPDSTSKIHGDAGLQDLRECEGTKCYQTYTPSTRFYGPASKRRSKNVAKISSAKVSELDLAEKNINNDFMPKNGLAGPNNGARENKISFFMQENFFFKFRESFLRHKVSDVPGDKVLYQHNNTFFEGVRVSAFHRFQQKIIANVQKLRSAEYSSSSDDEDDVLDETILREKFSASQRSETSKVVLGNPLKHGCPTTESGRFINKPVAGEKTFSFLNLSLRNEQKLHSLKKLGNTAILLPHYGTGLHVIKSQDQLETENGNETFKDNVTNKREPNVALSDLKYSVESKVTENDSKNTGASSETNPTFMKDEDEEDYLKCQMAFFEDISSDSDSNDTIIMDSYIEKHNSFHRNSAHYPTILSHNATRSNKYIGNTQSEDTTRLGSNPGIVNGDLTEDIHILASDITELSKTSTKESETSFRPDEQSEVHSCNQISVVVEISNLNQSNQNKENEIRNNLQVLETMNGTGHLPGVSLPRLSGEIGVRKLTDSLSVSTSNLYAIEDISPASEPAGFNLCGIDFASRGNIDKTDVKQIDTLTVNVPDENTPAVIVPGAARPTVIVPGETRPTVIVPGETMPTFIVPGETMPKVIVPGETMPAVIVSYKNTPAVIVPDENPVKANSIISNCKHENGVTDSRSHKKKCMKNLKVKRVQKNNYSNRRKQVGPENSSSDEENLQRNQLCGRRQPVGADNSTSDEDHHSPESKPIARSRRLLRQRRQTRYKFYSEELGSGEDWSGDSSDEATAVIVPQRKSYKYRNLKDSSSKQTKNAPQVGQDNGRASRGRRGRKKKSAGADKLLSSLSLLHMATLASLTDIQTDQPAPTSIIKNEEHSSHNSDRHNSDLNNKCRLSQDPMLHASLKKNTSDFEASQSFDEKNWDHDSQEFDGSDLPKRLLTSSHKQSRLKTGCNGVSNSGSKPLPISSFLNNCTPSSQIPSSFSFGHISDSSYHHEPAGGSTEDVYPTATTASCTLQLLETRRAQVNCASFSMKDILRLTTPDDSVDSDSKDSAAVLAPPEPRRAQVKSTALSMNDILKLTSADDADKSQITHLSTDPDCSTALSMSDILKLTSADGAESPITPLITDSALSRAQTSQQTSEASFSQVTFPRAELHQGAEGSLSLLCLKMNHISTTRLAERISDLARSHLASEKSTLVSKTPTESAQLLFSREGDSHKGSDHPKITITEHTSLGKCVSDVTGRYDHPKTSVTEHSTHDKCVSSVTEECDCSETFVVEPTSLDKYNSGVKGDIKSVVASNHENDNTEQEAASNDVLILKNNHGAKLSSRNFKGYSDENADNFSKDVPCGRMKEFITSVTENLNTKTTNMADVAPSFDAEGYGNDVYFSETSPVSPDKTSESSSSSQSVLYPKQENKIIKSPNNLGRMVSLEATESYQQAAEIKRPSLGSASLTYTSNLDSGQSSAECHQQSAKIKRPLLDRDILSDKSHLHFDQSSCIDNHPHHKVYEARISANLNYPQISTVSHETPATENITHRRLSLSSSTKSKNKLRNRTDVNMTSTELRPLHPLHIPSYPSYMNQDAVSQREQYSSKARNTSYYPYCWQWPVHTPAGSDTPAGPLNLCTTQKSPNNYSPITPTSPISPNYPTQAQGTTSSELSPPANIAKPLWYPWLSADTSSTSNIRPCDTNSKNNLSHDHKLMNIDIRSINTPTSKQNGPEQAVHITSPRNYKHFGSQRAKHNKIASSIKKNASKTGRDKPISLSQSVPAIDSASGCHVITQDSEATVDKPHELDKRSIPSSGYSENLTGADLRVNSELSNVVTLDGQQSSRLKESGGQCSTSESIFWNGDNAVTPDSLEYSSGKSFTAGHNNHQTCSITSGAINKRNFPVSHTFSSPTGYGDRGLVFKNKKERKGRFRTFKSNHSRLPTITEQLMAQLIRSDNPKHFHKETSLKTPNSVLIRRLHSSQKKSNSALNKSQSMTFQTGLTKGDEIDQDGRNTQVRGESSYQHSPDQAAQPTGLSPVQKHAEDQLQSITIRSQQSADFVH